MQILRQVAGRLGNGLLGKGQPNRPVETVTHSFLDGVPHLFDMGHKPKNTIAPAKHPVVRNPLTR
jgi:hypothetical protein